MNEKVNGSLIVKGSIGHTHTVLLTNKNEVITFGDNLCNQCTSAINNKKVLKPHFISKTKEIGIMRAIGAKRRDILIMFLFQGIIIGGIGASVGTAAGLGYTIYAMETKMSWEGSIPLEVSIQWDKVIQTALTSFTLAMVASLYPSYRATKLLPVEAMRTV